MTVITTLMPIQLFAETVPIIQTPYYTYSVSIGGGVCNPGDMFTLYSGEYPTKAEALAAALGIHKTVQCYSPYEGHCDISVQADPDPDRWQFWYTCYFNSFSETKHMWMPFYATYHTKHCPTPATRPEVPYTPDANGQTCSRQDQDSYTITLSGGTEVEPSKGSPIIANVVDQNTNQPPTRPVNVQISVKVDPTSGGHDHGDGTRPRGGIATVEACPSNSTCWSETSPANNGVVAFNFKAPVASGVHTITATCEGCTNTATKTVDVKVDGLARIPTSPFYTFIGETDKHTDNHYLTPEAATVLWRIAVSYQVEQQFKLQDPATGKFTVTPPALHVNDASLEWGGKFDLSGGWAGPHYEHRRGTVVDVRANGLGTAIPVENFRKFQRLANRYGADALLEEPDINRRHFHMRLLNREE